MTCDSGSEKDRIDWGAKVMERGATRCVGGRSELELRESMDMEAVIR